MHQVKVFQDLQSFQHYFYIIYWCKKYLLLNCLPIYIYHISKLLIINFIFLISFSLIIKTFIFILQFLFNPSLSHSNSLQIIANYKIQFIFIFLILVFIVVEFVILLHFCLFMIEINLIDLFLHFAKFLY